MRFDPMPGIMCPWKATRLISSESCLKSICSRVILVMLYDWKRAVVWQEADTFALSYFAILQLTTII